MIVSGGILFRASSKEMSVGSGHSVLHVPNPRMKRDVFCVECNQRKDSGVGMGVRDLDTLAAQTSER